MTPLRAAVLVFVIGASVANCLALKWRIDRLDLGPLPTASQLSQPNLYDLTDPYGGSPAPLPPSEVQRRLQSAQQGRVNTLAPFYDVAWVREAIIVTIAGVAWFLIRAKEPSA